MSHYSDKASNCRVDFFKPSGKWAETDEFSMEGEWDTPLIHDAVKRSLKKAFPDRYGGLTAVVLVPYHQHEHPVMLQDWRNDSAS